MFGKVYIFVKVTNSAFRKYVLLQTFLKIFRKESYITPVLPIFANMIISSQFLNFSNTVEMWKSKQVIRCLICKHVWYTHHVQANMTLQVHPWKKCQFRLVQRVHPVQISLDLSVVWTWIVVFPMDELEGSYSPVHSDTWDFFCLRSMSISFSYDMFSTQKKSLHFLF